MLFRQLEQALRCALVFKEQSAKLGSVDFLHQLHGWPDLSLEIMAQLAIKIRLKHLWHDLVDLVGHLDVTEGRLLVLPRCVAIRLLVLYLLKRVSEHHDRQHVRFPKVGVHVPADSRLVVRVIKLKLVRVVSKNVGELGVVVLEQHVVLAHKQHRLQALSFPGLLKEGLHVRPEGVLSLVGTGENLAKLLLGHICGNKHPLRQLSLPFVDGQLVPACTFHRLNELHVWI